MVSPLGWPRRARRRDGERPRLLGHALGDRRGQDRVGRQLDDDIDAARQHRLDRPGEVHGVPHVPAEVVDIDLAVIERTAGDGRVDGESGRPGLDGPDRRRELRPERLHLRGMEGVGHGERPVRHLTLFELLGHSLYVLSRAGQHHAARCVDSSHRDRHADLRRPAPCASPAVSPTDTMRPSPVARCMMRTAVPHDPRGLVQRQHTADVQRGQLSDAVADHGIRCDAPGLPGAASRPGPRKIAGCATSVSSNRGSLPASPALSGSTIPTEVRNRVDRGQGVGEDRLALQRARIPSEPHWAPCPEKTKATRPPPASGHSDRGRRGLFDEGAGGRPAS